MAYQPRENLYSFLGFVLWGDLSNLTMYRRADGRLVVFQKTWPDKPRSTKQLQHDAQFHEAAAAWDALTPTQREQWATAARRASTCATGYDLFLSAQLRPDPRTFATLARITSTTLEGTGV